MLKRISNAVEIEMLYGHFRETRDHQIFREPDRAERAASSAVLERDDRLGSICWTTGLHLGVSLSGNGARSRVDLSRVDVSVPEKRGIGHYPGRVPRARRIGSFNERAEPVDRCETH